ncbi:hypothetical protein [Kitasatospora sp. NPDC097643]|uniref:hypothetical protein n=1 Tax=Kitasatospora sp. NPDC097643 TaxID=3157230 RepID=UPI0033260027
MFRSSSPRDFHIPTDRETAEEFGRAIAAARNTPPDWFFLLGRQGTDGFLSHLDVRYHQGREFVACVQTSRPLPESFRVRSCTTPESELLNFLGNSDRIDLSSFVFTDLATTRISRDIRLNGLRIPVTVHHAHGCGSALLPQLPGQDGQVIVTAPDEHWGAVADLVLRPPAAF